MFKIPILLIFYTYFIYCAPQNTDSLFDGMICPSMSEKIQAAECVPLLKEFREKSTALASGNTKIDANDPRMTEFLEHCNKVQPCLESSCFPKNVTETIKFVCKGEQLKNSEFFNCMKNVIPRLEVTVLSNYTCFNAAHLNDMFEYNKNCIRTIMEDNCGEKSVENFDDNVETLLEGSTPSKPASSQFPGLPKIDFATLFDNCVNEEEKNEAGKCIQLLKDFGKRNDRSENLTKVEIVREDCSKVQNCLNSSCLPETLKNTMDKMCDPTNSDNNEFSQCLLKITHDLKLTNCIVDYDRDEGEIVSWLLTTKKECVKGIMEKNCGASAVMNFDSGAEAYLRLTVTLKPYSSKNQGKLETTTHNYVMESCVTIADKQKAAKCSTLMKEYSEKSIAAGKKVLAINGTEILELLDVCDKVQECVKPTCLPEYFKESLATGCKASELRNTEFSNCLPELKKQNPDSMRYPCVEKLSFADGPVEDGIILFTTKKECSKIIMKDVCGEKAVVDFDKNAAIIVELTKYSLSKTTTVAPRINNNVTHF